MRGLCTIAKEKARGIIFHKRKFLDWLTNFGEIGGIGEPRRGSRAISAGGGDFYVIILGEEFSVFGFQPFHCARDPGATGLCCLAQWWARGN
jgi:hypothetical protein